MSTLSPPTPAATAFRHLLKDEDVCRDDTEQLLELSAELKRQKASGSEVRRLVGKNIAILFEKPSTRTRAAFEVGSHDQGAATTYIDPNSSHLGSSESVEDTARVLGRLYDGIAFRGFAQSTVEDLARFSGVPVWNGLTDLWHPTQAIADLLTMREHSRKPLAEISVCFVGDARDNVSNSLMVAGATMGLDVRIAAPSTLQPSADVVAKAARIAAAAGGTVRITDDIVGAVRGCDFVYTDVWVSMGEADSEWAERVELLRPYRVTAALLASTGNPQTRFMHCLPSIHDDTTSVGRRLRDNFGLIGAEVDDEAFRSERSIVFDQAENRLHSIKAVMVASLAERNGRS